MRKIALVAYFECDRGQHWHVATYNQRGRCIDLRQHNTERKARQCAVALADEFDCPLAFVTEVLPGDLP